MLTQKEILDEVFALPVTEQRAIAEEIRDNINDATENVLTHIDQRELSIDERIAIAQDLSGSLKPQGSYIPMTKEEEREIIEEYLSEKYS
jgi:hypothetical protein